MLTLEDTRRGFLVVRLPPSQRYSANCTCPGHAVLLTKTYVEPNGRIECAMLVKKQPREIAIKSLAILVRIEVTIRHSPIRDRSRNAIDQLANAVFALIGLLRIAIEIFAHHDIGGQLTPCLRNLAVGLFEQGIAALIFDRCAALFPFHSGEGILNVLRTKSLLDLQSRSVTPRFASGLTASPRFTPHFNRCHLIDSSKSNCLVQTNHGICAASNSTSIQ